VFDSTVMPPKQVASIHMSDCVGWITFSLDGRFGYSSTGEIVDVASRKIVARLRDEAGREVQSEKMLEVDIANGKVVGVGNQFGIGMAVILENTVRLGRETLKHASGRRYLR
jgi:hypothetical protein